PSPLGKTAAIKLEIVRGGTTVFAGDTTLAQLKREPDLLVAFLTRETSFPDGAFLMTGTGIVPPNDFTLRAGDEIRIDITDVGRLVNVVAPS
ncbi:MAG TPA: fumarylacetoacetate hydrolase family protein, partial [Polyangia bacterium]|nr:fumarylacetoacetate hydrolase family protein [Polyangia bacterium]